MRALLIALTLAAPLASFTAPAAHAGNCASDGQYWVYYMVGTKRYWEYTGVCSPGVFDADPPSHSYRPR